MRFLLGLHATRAASHLPVVLPWPTVLAQIVEAIEDCPIDGRARMRAEKRSAGEFLPEEHSLSAARVAAMRCRGCSLWQAATQTVFGEGPRDARVMLVGEVPGDQEDRAGRPFVGPAGRLLDRALEAAGVERRDTYVTN